MERRHFLAGLAAMLASVGTARPARAFNEPPTWPKIRRELFRRVRRLPNSRSKRISLALLRHPDTTLRYDENGLASARWRGRDDLGACIHIHKRTGKLYLENQFARSKRRGKAPKYIQFGHRGQWYSRRHNGLDKALGIEKNWIDASSQRDGRALLRDLERALLR